MEFEDILELLSDEDRLKAERQMKLYGNTYIEITKHEGTPIGLSVLDPERVSVT